MQLSLEADSEVWTRVTAGVTTSELLSRFERAEDAAWLAMVRHHADLATSASSALASDCWLLADEALGIAAAVVLVAADGPIAIDGEDHAIALTEQLTGTGATDPLVSEALLARYPGYAVTQMHDVPEWLGSVTEEGDRLQLLQTVVVAADGQGTLRYASVSPQLSNVAGLVLLPVMRVLQSAVWV